MPKGRSILPLICLASLLIAAACLGAEPPAHEHHPAPPGPGAASPATGPAMPEQPVVTHHTLKIGGQTLHYTATAGFQPVDNEAGKPQANIFYIEYTLDAVASVQDRPITFAFNGGPGASSVWLHMGALGPKRVVLGGDGTALPATYRLTDNDQSWLDFTDLVFVDPIGTGFSRAAEGVDPHQFYNLARDVEVAGRFIRLFVTRQGRWLSPKFVAGESYGTTRAAGVANLLQDQSGLNLSGVMLLSSALSFQAFSYDDGNDIAYALAVPTYAAAAAYHHKASATRAQAEQWAMTEYLDALGRGDNLTDAQRQHVAHAMAGITGLSEDYILTSHLRVGARRFTKELLRSQQRTLGLMDSRVVGIDFSPRGEYPRYDPAFFVVTGPYVAAVNDYLHHDLNFQTDRPYEFLSNGVNGSWKWVDRGQGYVYVADDLAAAMTRDAHFRVFAGAGEYDLTTPYFGQKYTFDHMGLDPVRRANLVFRTYPTGHQIYTDEASLKALHGDVAAFVEGKPMPVR